MQERSLLLAETAVFECRFADAYPILKSILHAPDDIYIEIGSLWSAGLCCIALNKPDDFSRIFLHLKMLLSDDFPYRDDLSLLLDALKTYIETISSATNSDVLTADIDDQCIPLACLLIGYSNLSKEAINPGVANISLLEVNLRLLENTGAIIAIEMMHCYLLGIYLLRQDMSAAKRHAKAAVRIAFENKFFFPLITLYNYYSLVLDPILEQYPEDFQQHCRELYLQYNKNSATFFSNIGDYTAISELNDEDYTFIYGVLTNLSNAAIADKLGISKPTVNRKLLVIYEKLCVNNKQELRAYLLKHI